MEANKWVTLLPVLVSKLSMFSWPGQWKAGVHSCVRLYVLKQCRSLNFSKSDPLQPSSFSNTLWSYLWAMREYVVKYIYSICRYEYRIHTNVFIWALSSWKGWVVCTFLYHIDCFEDIFFLFAKWWIAFWTRYIILECVVVRYILIG